ncbi:MAG: DUF898 domain-containing protein [Gammaproteobacteria bacterium]|nr:DUF898 domain-containing protein [Gammaproteobacteria bacterium]MYE28621.1 DUF898 domain-containing protein [Gammaproteobacteria bacterium]MYI02925.1 DUF898 domain-containing protein [Gammaproteobacteria bacterium]
MIDSGHPGSSEVESTTKQQTSIEPFTFHGNGSDYFRIWIVNMLFTILTLGIYSAWAKVRSKRYFGGNRFRSSVSIEYVLLILSNTFLIIVTLGFFYPWAAVRRARYLMENIQLEARELDSFAAGEFDHASAQGEEFGEAFDLGLGF